MSVPSIVARHRTAAASSPRPARAVSHLLLPADAWPAGACDWPLRGCREFPAVPEAVRSARADARQMLREWHIDALSETVELLVSEIVTNAVRTTPRRRGAAARRPVRVWLCSDTQRVLIQVWDGGRQRPAVQAPGPDAESGRGLLLVEALSEQWGCLVLDAQRGKIVWALCES